MFQSQYIEKLLNVSQFFQHFLIFFCGQKGISNFNFRTNFTLIIKKKLAWDLLFAYSGQFSVKMLTIFLKIATLKH